MFGALERGEGRAGQSTPRLPALSAGSTMARASSAGGSASSCAGGSPWPASSQTRHLGWGFLMSCVLPRVLCLSPGSLLSPEQAAAPPWVSGSDSGSPSLSIPAATCACVLGPFPHWAAPCSPDGVSSPLPAPDSYLARWLHKP